MVTSSFLQKVIFKKQIRPAEFLKFLSSKQRRELLKQAKYLLGKRVVHINATAVGGGVAEILQSLVPYLRALGIESDWYVINPKIGGNFFSITNKIHDAMQGAAVKISGKEWKKYERISKLNPRELDKNEC